MPAPTNPYTATTNSDLIVSESFDDGSTWSAPTAVMLNGDQFLSWAHSTCTGTLRLGSFDRRADPANHLYGYSLVTQPRPSTSRVRSLVDDTQSDPTQNDRWFAATLDRGLPVRDSFLGDYSNIAVVPGTTPRVAYWTDMRETSVLPGQHLPFG